MGVVKNPFSALLSTLSDFVSIYSLGHEGIGGGLTRYVQKKKIIFLRMGRTTTLLTHFFFSKNVSYTSFEIVVTFFFLFNKVSESQYRNESTCDNADKIKI